MTPRAVPSWLPALCVGSAAAAAFIAVLWASLGTIRGNSGTERIPLAPKGSFTRADEARTSSAAPVPDSGDTSAEIAVGATPLLTGSPAEEALQALLTADPETQASLLLSMRERPTPDLVQAAIRAWRTSREDRSRALLLFFLSGTRDTVVDAERDTILDVEAIPYLRDIALRPADDATRPAILALSDLRSGEASRLLALVVQDPRDPIKAGDALSAMIVRPHRTGVRALEDLAAGRASLTTKLRALRGLLTLIQTWDRDGTDPDVRDALGEARRFVYTDGLGIASIAETQSGIPEVREEASLLQIEIAALRDNPER
ncbi:MAG: hypothetical protein HYY93_13575 [Planctomycetes bacterium]|nr:hypothetical protein [Planctomycetota bacterium]